MENNISLSKENPQFNHILIWSFIVSMLHKVEIVKIRDLFHCQSIPYLI